MEIKVKHQRTGRNALLPGFLVVFLPNLSFFFFFEFFSCNAGVLRRYGRPQGGVWLAAGVFAGNVELQLLEGGLWWCQPCRFKCMCTL